MTEESLLQAHYSRLSTADLEGLWQLTSLDSHHRRLIREELFRRGVAAGEAPKPQSKGSLSFAGGLAIAIFVSSLLLCFASGPGAWAKLAGLSMLAWILGSVLNDVSECQTGIPLGLIVALLPVPFFYDAYFLGLGILNLFFGIALAIGSRIGAK